MKKYLLLTALVALIVGCGTPAPTETDLWTPPALADADGELPEGRDVVQRMVDFMQANQEFAVEARVTYESVQDSGEKLQFEMLQRVAMQKPDRLHWVTLKDDATIDKAWIDRGRFRMIRQPANLWGEVRVPINIPEAVRELVDNYRIDVPFPDLLSKDPTEQKLDEDITSIWYVGEALVGGQWTDHVAIRRPGADIQVWVHQGEPYPAKMAIVFTEDGGRPSYTARFSNWTNTLPEDTSAFEFVPPPGAEQIDVVPVIDQSPASEGGSQ